MHDFPVGVTDYQGIHMGCTGLSYIARMFVYRIHTIIHSEAQQNKMLVNLTCEVQYQSRASDH